MGIKYRDNNTIKDISIKVGDNIPVGAEFDYNGQTIPAGYEEVTGSSGTRIKKVSSTVPTTGQVVDSLSSNSTTDAPSIRAVNELNTYSTDEQVIGKWIDGKPLYRKTIKVDTSSSFINSALTKYEHKISNIEKIIKATSTAKTSWGGGWFTDITLAINKFQIRADETYLYIKNDSGSDYKLEYLAVILEYTKTTD